MPFPAEKNTSQYQPPSPSPARDSGQRGHLSSSPFHPPIPHPDEHHFNYPENPRGNYTSQIDVCSSSNPTQFAQQGTNDKSGSYINGIPSYGSPSTYWTPLPTQIAASPHIMRQDRNISADLETQRARSHRARHQYTSPGVQHYAEPILQTNGLDNSQTFPSSPPEQFASPPLVAFGIEPTSCEKQGAGASPCSSANGLPQAPSTPQYQESYLHMEQYLDPQFSDPNWIAAVFNMNQSPGMHNADGSVPMGDQPDIYQQPFTIDGNSVQSNDFNADTRHTTAVSAQFDCNHTAQKAEVPQHSLHLHGHMIQKAAQEASSCKPKAKRSCKQEQNAPAPLNHPEEGQAGQPLAASRISTDSTALQQPRFRTPDHTVHLNQAQIADVDVPHQGPTPAPTRAKAQRKAKKSTRVGGEVPSLAKDPSTGLFFTSLADARQRVQTQSWSYPDNDSTIPLTDAEKQQWVRRLVSAFLNLEGIQDKDSGPVLKARWLKEENGQRLPADYYYGGPAIEKVCWVILDITIRLHTEGPGWLDIEDRELWKKAENESDLNFQQHMEALIALFHDFKNRCDKMMKADAIIQTILTAKEAKKTAMSNRAANDVRQENLRKGREINNTPTKKAKAPAKPRGRPKKVKEIIPLVAPIANDKRHDEDIQQIVEAEEPDLTAHDVQESPQQPHVRGDGDFPRTNTFGCNAQARQLAGGNGKHTRAQQHASYTGHQENTPAAYNEAVDERLGSSQGAVRTYDSHPMPHGAGFPRGIRTPIDSNLPDRQDFRQSVPAFDQSEASLQPAPNVTDDWDNLTREQSQIFNNFGANFVAGLDGQLSEDLAYIQSVQLPGNFDVYSQELPSHTEAAAPRRQKRQREETDEEENGGDTGAPHKRTRVA